VNNSAAVLSPVLFIVCGDRCGIAVAATIVYRLTGLGSARTEPVAAAPAATQLAAVAAVLAAPMARLWSPILVLAVMFVVATVTAARPSQSEYDTLLENLIENHCEGFTSYHRVPHRISEMK
jgi:putative ABC transport system permease protein